MITKTFSVLLSLIPVASLLSGCAFGVTNVRVSHSELASVGEKRMGTILVRQFSDSRPQDHQYIGAKRNGFGMAVGNLGVRDGTHLDILLTGFFADALKQAGYEAI